MIILLLTWLLGPGALTPADAAAHVGEKATVCGVVDDARYLDSAKLRPTFLNFGGRYPDHQFTAVIFGADRAAFGTPERAWLGKRICVWGPITLFKGKPQIVLKSVTQLEPDEPVEPRGLLVGISPIDPITLTMVAAGLGAVALLACYLPARRVTRIDPVQALRQE